MPSGGVFANTGAAAPATGVTAIPARQTATKSRDLDDRQHVLRARRGLEAREVDERQGHHQQRRPQRGRVGTERHETRHVVAEHEREQRDRPGVDDRRARPRIEEAHVAAVRAGDEVIVAARMRIGRCEFGVAQRADQRDDPARHPQREHPADVAGDAGHHRRRAEYAGADDDADDDRDGVAPAQQRQRAGARRGGAVDSRSSRIVHLAAAVLLVRIPDTRVS